MAAANAAIKSFNNQLILIMGGIDKGSTDFGKMIPKLINRVKQVFTYGNSGKLIKQKFESVIKTTYINDFDSAIIEAVKEATDGDIILLSPACASFDQFDNYEERGNAFKKIFNKLELEN